MFALIHLLYILYKVCLQNSLCDLDRIISTARSYNNASLTTNKLNNSKHVASDSKMVT